MVSSITENRRKKRLLLAEISRGFSLLYEACNASNSKVDKLPMIQLQGSKMDVENFLKWSRAAERESTEPSLCANDGDGMERIAQNKVFFTGKTEVKKE